MARKPRFVLPGVPQHIIQRGNNREPCFFGVSDYEQYLHNLLEASDKNNVAIHAYVLMTNHIHLLATPGDPHSISHMMQDLGRKYVRYINTSYARTGTLWEGRYKASLVDSDAYLFTCMRYIELNPVRANMVTHPGDYSWSSYGRNAAGKIDQLITHHPLYSSLGDSQDCRLHAYRELFKTDIDPAHVHEIRDALGQELVLGRDDFKEKIAQVTKRQIREGLPGRPRINESAVIYYIF